MSSEEKQPHREGEKKKLPRVRRCQMALFAKDTSLEELEYRIKSVVERYGTIERWTYILHDRDIKAPHDVIEFDENGNTISVEPHFHVALAFNTPISLDNVAKWFKVEPNFINKINGSKHFGYFDVVNYFTHVDCVNKVKYDTSSIRCNYDYEKYIADMQLKKAKGSRASKENLRDKLINMVFSEGVLLEEIMDKYPVEYIIYINALKNARKEYLLKQPYPTFRQNYYICGKAGEGKSIASTAMARYFGERNFPNVRKDKLIFSVKADNVTFEGYDGEPIIIWNDFRAEELYKALKTRGNIFDTFDTNPQNSNVQNIKFGSVKLLNAINIINSVQDYKEFIFKLCGGDNIYAKEDMNQARRRFPLIIHIHDDNIDTIVNCGYYLDTHEYETYKLLSTMRTNLKAVLRSEADREYKLEQTKKLMSQIAEQELIKRKYETVNSLNKAENLPLGEVVEAKYEFIEAEDKAEDNDLFDSEKVDVIDNPFEDNKEGR